MVELGVLRRQSLRIKRGLAALLGPKPKGATRSAGGEGLGKRAMKVMSGASTISAARLGQARQTGPREEQGRGSAGRRRSESHPGPAMDGLVEIHSRLFRTASFDAALGTAHDYEDADADANADADERVDVDCAVERSERAVRIARKKHGAGSRASAEALVASARALQSKAIALALNGLAAPDDLESAVEWSQRSRAAFERALGVLEDLGDAGAAATVLQSIASLLEDGPEASYAEALDHAEEAWDRGVLASGPDSALAVELARDVARLRQRTQGSSLCAA